MTPSTLLSRLATLPPDPAQVPLPGLRPLARCEPSRLLRGSYRDLDLLEPVGVGREPHSAPLPCPAVDASRYMVGCGRLF